MNNVKETCSYLTIRQLEYKPHLSYETCSYFTCLTSMIIFLPPFSYTNSLISIGLGSGGLEATGLCVIVFFLFVTLLMNFVRSNMGGFDGLSFAKPFVASPFSNIFAFYRGGFDSFSFTKPPFQIILHLTVVVVLTVSLLQNHHFQRKLHSDRVGDFDSFSFRKPPF